MWKTFLFVYYVAVGISLIIVMKATGVGGQSVEYKTTFAILLVEAIKWALAETIDRFGSKQEAKIAEPPVASATTSWKNWARYGAPSFLYALTNNLNVYAVMMVGAHVYALFINSKLIFAAVTNWLLLGQKFTSVQWTALILLSLTLCVAKVKTILGCDSKRMLAGESFEDDYFSWYDMSLDPGLMEGSSGNNLLLPRLANEKTELVSVLGFRVTSQQSSAFFGGSFSGPRVLSENSSDEAATFILGMGLIALTSFLSGLAGTVNEFLLKSADEHLSTMRKNCYCYQWGCFLNTMGMLLTNSMAGSTTSESLNPDSNQTTNFFLGLFKGFTPAVWGFILLQVCLGLTVSLVLRHLDNVTKGIGASVMLFGVTFISWIVFHAEIDAGFLIGLGLFCCFSHLYLGDHNKVLEQAAKKVPLREVDLDVEKLMKVQTGVE